MPPLTEMRMALRLPEKLSRPTAFSPGGSLHASFDDGELVLRDVPLYGIVLLER